MFLKRIEMVGFKSFARKTVLELTPGMTSIVGPNGSGKSNVVDAIRWVLGEQSARQLRGERMEDLIFSGSRQHRPLGQARVRIVLDNHDGGLPVDYREIEIGRRVDRDGTSDYRLNRRSCRLKDVRQLLSGTGLGPHGYSIISQGEITSLVSESPEERLQRLYEAAGVSGFQQQLNGMDRRLERTHRSLTRIQPVLEELEDRLQPLRRVRQRAENHRKSKRQWQSLDRRWSVAAYSRALCERARATKYYQQAQKRLQQTENQFNQIEAEWENLTDEFRELESEIHTARAQQKPVRRRRDQLQTRIQVLKERKLSLDDRFDQLKDERAEVSDRRNDMKEQIRRKKKQANRQEQRLKQLQEWDKDIVQRIKSLQEQMSGVDAQRRKQQKQHQDDARQIGRFEAELERLKTKLKRLDRQEVELAGETPPDLEPAGQALEEKKQEIERTDARIIDLESALKRLTEERNELEVKRNRVRESLKEHRQRLDELFTRLHQWKQQAPSQAAALDRSVEAYLRSLGYDISGKLWEVLEVERVYQRAVAAALAGRLQLLLVEDDQRTGGRARDGGTVPEIAFQYFDPRYVKPGYRRRTQQDVPSKEGVLGPLLEQVQVKDASFKTVINPLLGSYLLVESNVNEPPPVLKHVGNWHCVTTDGWVYRADGIVRSPGQVVDVFTYRKKLRALETSQQDVQEAVDDLEVRRRQLERELERHDHQMEQVRERVRKAREQRSDQRQRLDVLTQAYEKQRDRQQNQERQKQQVQQEKSDIRQRMNQVQKQKAQVEARANGFSDSATDVGQRIERVLEQVRQSRSKVQTRLASLESDCRQLTAWVSRLEKDQGSADRREQQLAERIETITEQRTDVVKEIAAVETELKETAGQLDQVGNNIASLREQRKQLKDRQDRLHHQLQQLQQTLHQSENAHQQWEEEQQRKRDEVEKRSVQLKEYGFQAEAVEDDPEEVLPESLIRFWHLGREPEADLGELKKRRDQARRRLKEHPPVDSELLREYRRIKTRFQTLSRQVADVTCGHQFLEQQMDDWNRVLEERAVSTYEALTRAFQDTFTLLFEGGTARLQLQTDDEGTPVGVDVRVQPPGKSLKHLSLLSGGERALSGIALTFAFLRVQPAPFCLLDEIDAALDAENVERFARFIRAESEHTQCVMVTHQKRTMEEARTLYGITMDQRGFSQAVSVRLAEVEDRWQEEAG